MRFPSLVPSDEIVLISMFMRPRVVTRACLFMFIMLPKVAARFPICECEDAFGLREGDGGGAEGVGVRARGLNKGKGSSVLHLEVLENGREHCTGSLMTGESSGRIMRGDCASRRLDAALLMALVMVCRL